MHQRSRACSTPSTKRGSVDEPSAEFQEQLQCFLSRTDRIPNAKNAVILKESEFKNQANHIVHLTQKHTVKLKRTNQLSLEEQDELLARIVYGRTDSVLGSDLVIGPTGCAAYNAGGCTWQSAPHKRRESEKNTSRPLAQETGSNLQAKLRGVKFVIFDEFSMLSCKDFLDINRRLKAAQPTPEARSQCFGGLHILFCGDFYQLPPVSGTSFYESNTTSALDKAGLELWQRME